MGQSLVDSLWNCYIEDGEVIYEFDIRKADSLSSSQLMVDFEDLDYLNAAKSGQASFWEKNGWFLKQLSQFTFQLRKKLDDFVGHISYAAKHNLHKNYWIEPRSEFSTENVIRDERLIDPQGNITFRLDGRKAARQVILSGSFNDWTENSFFMQKTQSGWELTLDLSAGIYEYKFIVDGEWMHDPMNEMTIENQHQTLNSILLVGQEVTFDLYGFAQAEEIYLVGSFNNWEEDNIPMHRRNGKWTTSLEIPPGKHYYKYIVDGEWITDPSHRLTQSDQRGNLNSVLLIN